MSSQPMMSSEAAPTPHDPYQPYSGHHGYTNNAASMGYGSMPTMGGGMGGAMGGGMGGAMYGGMGGMMGGGSTENKNSWYSPLEKYSPPNIRYIVAPFK